MAFDYFVHLYRHINSIGYAFFEALNSFNCRIRNNSHYNAQNGSKD